MLTGSQLPANFNKMCVRADGDVIAVNVQISCVWKEGAPQYFVCYVRRRDADGNVTSGLPPHQQARVQMLSSSGSETFSNPSHSPCSREFSLEGDGMDGDMYMGDGGVKAEHNYPSFSALGIDSSPLVGN